MDQRVSPPVAINQLAILIVSGRQAGDLMDQLSKNGFYFTKIDSSGGIFQEPTVCLFIGLNDSRLPTLLHLVRQYCKPQKEYIPTHLNLEPGNPALTMIEAKVGGALIHVLKVVRFEQL